MLAFIILFIAPVFQIILSALRVQGKISTPFSIIAVYAIVIGVVFIILALHIVANDTYDPTRKSQCGEVSAAFGIIGFMILLIATPIILLFFYAVHKSNSKQLPTNIDEPDCGMM